MCYCVVGYYSLRMLVSAAIITKRYRVAVLLNDISAVMIGMVTQREREREEAKRVAKKAAEL